jgi:tetratricopeptide (TPR) repeat protein
VGKSLLAEEYALRFGAAWPGGIFWLQASQAQPSPNSAATVDPDRDTQLYLIAADLQLDVDGRTPEQIAGDIRAYIERVDARCLWIVDDVPSGLGAERARGWFAQAANATTLITTRTREYALLGREVPLSGLPPADGFALLTAKRTPEDEAEQAAANGIVADLAGHPLALAVAGAALRSEAGLRSFAEYRADLSQPSADELELATELADALPTGHEASVASTLLRSIRQLGEEGRDLLRLASVLASAPIPTSLIASTFAKADNVDSAEARRVAVRAISAVDRLSLAEIAGPDGQTRQVHPLVVRTVRFRDTAVARRLTLQSAAAGALGDMLGDFIASGGAALNGQSLISHARELVRGSGREIEVGYLQDQIAEYDRMRGDYNTAASAQAQLLDERTNKLGEGHPDTLMTMNNLALTLYGQGGFAAARRFQERALDLSRQTLGEDDHQTIAALHNLAQTVWAQGELDRARPLQEDVVEKSRRAFGEDDALTLSAMGNLAQTLYGQGDLDRARELQTQVLDGRRRVLGPDHPETLGTMGNLALTREKQGALDEARNLQEQVVGSHRRILGEGHPRTLLAENNLATALMQYGDVDSARALLQIVVSECQQMLGPDSPLTLAAMDNLASSLRLQGELSDALDIHQEVVDRGRRVLGEDHPQTVTAVNGLLETLANTKDRAQALFERGDLDHAGALQQEMVNGYRLALGLEHRETLNAMGHLSYTAYVQGRLDDARELLEAILKISRRVLGVDDEDTQTVMSNLALTLSALGRFAEARELLQELVDTRRRVLGPGHPDTLIAMNVLAVVQDEERAGHTD